MIGEFNSRPLAVGSVRLVRRWLVTPSLRLRSLSMCSLWVPGVNIARCPRLSGRYTEIVGGGWMLDRESERRLDQTTRMLDQCPTKCADTCACGFYGYFDPQFQEFAGTVEGVIEGWGRCTIGSKGAQVGKAKILALAPIPADLSADLSADLPSTVPFQPVQTSEPMNLLLRKVGFQPETRTETSPLMQQLCDKYQVPAYLTVGEAIEDYPLGEVT